MAYLRTFLIIAFPLLVTIFFISCSGTKPSRVFESSKTYFVAAGQDFIPHALNPIPSCGTSLIKVEQRTGQFLSFPVRVIVAQKTIDRVIPNNKNVISIYLTLGVLRI
ncbi:MAG: hypothetical protein JNM78_10220 [Cyclobacteriaceae bacterium]|nr:hypothetical protein [Cyclobacteriaceae bacterium]